MPGFDIVGFTEDEGGLLPILRRIFQAILMTPGLELPVDTAGGER